jgi:NAD(P)-dependent dehydrogenase (short-subunit alcohol dehydrogenase family)
MVLLCHSFSWLDTLILKIQYFEYQGKEAKVSARTAIVTGGGTGIGRAIAATFARSVDEVVIVGRRASVLQSAAVELEAESPRPVRWRSCDVSDPGQIDDFVDWLAAEGTGSSTSARSLPFAVVAICTRPPRREWSD